GAALGDDLRNPEVAADGASGWAQLPGYNQAQTLPEGVVSLANHVTGTAVMTRRMGQIGLVDARDGARLQSQLKPGQRLVSLAGDLWRWDGFRVGAEDAPSAAALRLQQLNRLVELKRDLEEANTRAAGAAQAHQHLRKRLDQLTEADRMARQARRDPHRLVADTGRALSRAESERSIAATKLESAQLAVSRHEEEALGARSRLKEAEAAVVALGDLNAARAQVEDVKMTVDAARMTMLAKRSAHDELRREGEARTRRRQEITKEISGWRHRLDTAEKRIAELAERKEAS
ncbi:chromosome segregation protein SMC, partial [Escherichia coli]|nr:chromosome segregation protein SMC [Escherichia coli]